MLVLIVEDDKNLAELVMEFLEAKDFECDYTGSGKVAVDLIINNRYDAIVLDINLPGMDGFEICQTIRRAGITTPCIMLTAKGMLDDKLKGFDVGADDYLVKPFAMPELAARLNAVALRNNRAATLRVSDLEIDVAKRIVKRGECVINLSPDEWRALLVLARNANTVVAKEVLEAAVWGGAAPSNNAMKMLLYRLRKAIDGGEQSKLLHTIRGVGYRLGRSAE